MNLNLRMTYSLSSAVNAAKAPIEMLQRPSELYHTQQRTWGGESGGEGGGGMSRRHEERRKI
jgi:hypothetical protein